MEKTEPPIVTMEDYMNIYKMTVLQRVRELPDEDKRVLQELPNSPFAEVLSKVLGPELSGVSAGAIVEPQPETPQEEIQPRRMGLGSR